MKRFWHQCLAMIAVAAMAGTANAQWNQQPEIGSYQSILSRAGYGQQSGTTMGTQLGVPNAQPMAHQTMGVAPSHSAMPAAAGQMTGTPLNYGQMTGGTTGQVTGGMVSGQVIGGCNTGAGSVVSGGMVGGPVVAGGMPSYTDCGSAGGCGAPVYQPGVGVGLGAGAGLGQGFASRAGLGGGRNVNRVGSIFGVVMRRNYEDDVRLAYNGAGMEVFSGDVDQGNMSGLGASLINRNCNGNGWEFVYWGVDDDADISLSGPSFTNLMGLANLNHVPSGFTMFDIFNNGTDARFYRDVEINSVAFNLLRNGGQYQTRRGRSANFELLGGLRLFQFDESFRYVSNSVAPYPLTSEYQLQAENFLVGLQFGGRNEICLSNRLRLATAATVGLFNNRADTRQRIFDETGYNPVLAGGPSAGRPFDYSAQRDDVAMMGELDLGLIYQLSSKFRARVGYRAMGVSGVALAVDQIPYDFNDAVLLQEANTNGSLFMQGLYFGTEFLLLTFVDDINRRQAEFDQIENAAVTFGRGVCFYLVELNGVHRPLSLLSKAR